jgi:hypothetical protein
MHGLTKQLGRCLVACAPVIGLAMALGPAAGASTAQPAKQAHLVHSAPALANARAELYKLLKHQHITMRYVSTGASSLDGNWSGYGDTGSGFTKVSASWKEPTAKCGASTTLASFWVGIGGFSSTPFVQAGTIIQCSGGSPSYFTWWEVDPTDPVQVVGETLQPGDSVSASVTRSAAAYTIKLTDSTTPGNSFSKKVTCSDCNTSSAEWISLAPTIGSAAAALTNFGTWRATSAKVATSAKSGTISSFTHDEFALVDSSGNIMAQPGALNTTGSAFSDVFKKST